MVRLANKKYNLLYGQSYAFDCGVTLKILNVLERKLVTHEKERVVIKKPYGVHIPDMVEKFGFMLLARDQIKAIGNSDQKVVKYHCYNFIFHTKSFLDSISTFLNTEYNLGFKGGEIDLKHGKFITALKEKNSELVQKIDQLRNWISNVVEYRDALIHKHGLWICPATPEDFNPPVGNSWSNLDIRIPWDPTMTIENYATKLEEVKKRYGEVMRPMNDLCKEWLDNSKEILELVLEDLDQRLTSVTKE